MTDDHEWSEWRDHDGKGCPVVGQVVHLVVGPDGFWKPEDHGEWEPGFTPINPAEAIGIAKDDGGWNWEPPWFPVIRYRVRRPKALRDLIELVENLPAPAKSRETVR